MEPCQKLVFLKGQSIAWRIKERRGSGMLSMLYIIVMSGLQRFQASPSAIAGWSAGSLLDHARHVNGKRSLGLHSSGERWP